MGLLTWPRAWWVVKTLTAPTPPIVEKVKTAAREVHAGAEILNLVLPDVPTKGQP